MSEEETLKLYVYLAFQYEPAIPAIWGQRSLTLVSMRQDAVNNSCYGILSNQYHIIVVQASSHISAVLYRECQVPTLLCQPAILNF